MPTPPPPQLNKGASEFQGVGNRLVNFQIENIYLGV
jgi:hypothetical protein